jgi:hypothetical protein
MLVFRGIILGCPISLGAMGIDIFERRLLVFVDDATRTRRISGHG